MSCRASVASVANRHAIRNPQLSHSAVARLCNRHGRLTRTAAFSSCTPRRNQAAAVQQTLRTEGPLYTAAPKATSFSRRVSIPLDQGDDKPIEFQSIFLRDSCVCPACVDPSSSQKNFQTSDIPVDIEGAFRGITSSIQQGTEHAVLRWSCDVKGFEAEQHESIVPVSLLRRSAAGDQRTHVSHFKPANRVFWNNEIMSRDNKFVDFGDYMCSDMTFYQTLKRLESHGLAFIMDVPDCTDTDSSKSLTQIVQRIGPVKSTFYGMTWDVRSVPKAINVAYTNVFLALHADLCYTDYIPQYQFLHSLRARAPAGESMFSDAFAAADKLRLQDPELFKSLCTFPVTFHYYNDGQSYRQIRTTLELANQNDLTSPIKAVNWSPPFQGPLAQDIGSKDDGKALRTFVEAAHTFEQVLSSPENVFELRMNEGECAIFDNRRVLHARRAFDPSKGERWLKGAYSDRDVFASKLARLEEIYGQ